MKVAVDHFGAHISYIFFFFYFGLFIYFLNDTCFWLDLETANTLFVMVHYAAFAGPDLLSSSKQLVTPIPVSGARLFFFFFWQECRQKKKRTKQNKTYLVRDY